MIYPTVGCRLSPTTNEKIQNDLLLWFDAGWTEFWKLRCLLQLCRYNNYGEMCPECGFVILFNKLCEPSLCGLLNITQSFVHCVNPANTSLLNKSWLSKYSVIQCKNPFVISLVLTHALSCSFFWYAIHFYSLLSAVSLWLVKRTACKCFSFLWLKIMQ